MEREPILRILKDMVGTSAELDIVLNGDHKPIELRNVTEVEPLHSSHGIKIATRSNTIWIDASHVSAMWQARMDGS